MESVTIYDKSVNEGLLQLVMSYTGFPFTANHKTVKWGSVEDNTVGIFPLQGAKYLSRDILGGYKAQFPFRLIFQSNPTNNPSNIMAQEVVENLAKWLETCSLDFLDPHMHLVEIRQTSPVFAYDQENTMTQYTCTMQLVYEKE